MPELPEVQTIAFELNRKLKNRIIKSVVVNAPKMVAVGPGTVSNIRRASKRSADKFIRLLTGRKFLLVKRRAKLLIFHLSGQLFMLVHLKMTGQFIFEDNRLRKKTGGPFGIAQGRPESYRSVGLYRMFNKLTAPLVLLPGKHTHVIFEFTDGAHLYFNDIRKFGYMKLVFGNELDRVRELKEYGPEPLDKKFTPDTFSAAAQNVSGRRKIKEALMDAKVVAGIGNIYSDEILFHAGVRPLRAVSSLSNKELSVIYKWIKWVLIKAIKAKGSSVGDFVRTDGSWGQMGKFHFVYGRKGQKCKRCGTTIKSIKLGGRTGSFCPRCQK